MKAIRMAVLLMVVATAARGAETSSMVSERYSAATRCAIGTESGTTWTGNDADHPIYCATPSGGSGGAVTQGSPPWTFDLTKLNGTTVSTSNPLPTSPVWCPTAALTKISSLTTLTANTANQSVSAGCTGACAKVSCVNGSSVLVRVRPAGATNYIPLGPYGSVEFTGVAACEFSTQTPADTTATPAASTMGCDDA